MSLQSSSEVTKHTPNLRPMFFSEAHRHISRASKLCPMLPEELTFVQFVLQSMGGIRFIELLLGSTAGRGEIQDFALSSYFHYDDV